MALAFLVDSIPREPAKHNLIDSAVKLAPPEGDARDRWIAGFTWKPAPCYEARVWDASCSESPDALDTELTLEDDNTYTPVLVYLPYECHANGFEFEADEERVKNWLRAAAPKAVEAEFWASSLSSTNWSLTSDTPQVSGTGDPPGGILQDGAAVSPEVALLSLTQALANCGAGSRGMIHVPPYLAQTWAGREYLYCEEVDGVERLVTKARGDIVVVGSGYSGTGPDDEAPAEGTVWAYATQMVGLRMTEIELRPGDPKDFIDRTNNVITWIAEMYVGIQLDDCCVFAVNVDVP